MVFKNKKSKAKLKCATKKVKLADEEKTENDTPHSTDQPATSYSHNQSLCDESMVNSFSFEEERSYCASASFESCDDIFFIDDVDIPMNDDDELLPVDVQIECSSIIVDSNRYADEKSNLWIPVVGYRLVDLNHLTSWLVETSIKHATECTSPKIYLFGEKIINMDSTLFFRCESCHSEFMGNTVSHQNKGELAKNIVYATVTSGHTFAGTEEFLSTLDCPMLSKDSFYKVENAMHDHLEAAVENSIQKAFAEERSIAIEEGRLDTEGFACLDVSCDGGYAKRSYGTKYDAASCVGIIRGEATKKILHVKVMNKNCSIKGCEEGVPHRCFKNYSGPSNGMETEAVASGFNESLRHQVKMTNIITDGDCKTFKKAKEICSYSAQLVKEDCANHAVKATGKRLRKLVHSSKSEAMKVLSSQLARISKDIRCAIKHCAANNGTAESLSEDIRNVPFHVFGDHKNCKEYFCPVDKRSEDASSMIVLLKEKYFQLIRREIEPIALKSPYLVRGKTSNLSENFFSMVVKFIAGKRIYLSGRGSYNRRVMLAVLLCNEGYWYHTKIFSEIVGREPGKTFKSYMDHREKEKHRTSPKKTSKRITNRATGYIAEADEDNDIVMEEELLEMKSKYVLSDDTTERLKTSVSMADLERFAEGRVMSQDVNDIVRSRGVKSMDKKSPLLISRARNSTWINANRSVIGIMDAQEPNQFIKNRIFIDSCHPYLCCIPDGVSIDGELIVLIKRRRKSDRQDLTASTEVDSQTVIEAQTAMHCTKAQKCVLYFIDMEDPTVFCKNIAEYDESCWNNKIRPKIQLFENMVYKQTIRKNYNVRN